VTQKFGQGPRQVNLSNAVMKNLGKGSDEFEDYASLDFSKAYEEIEGLIRRDTLRGFLTDDTYFEKCFGML
jgi:hypothetical protein